MHLQKIGLFAISFLARSSYCFVVLHKFKINHRELLVFWQVGKTIRIGGWVKTGREAGGGQFAFVHINDGTAFESIQVSSLTSQKAQVTKLQKLDINRYVELHSIHFTQIFSGCRVVNLLQKMITFAMTMQVVVSKEVAEKEPYSMKLALPTGTSLLIEGVLEKAPEDSEQVSLQLIRISPQTCF